MSAFDASTTVVVDDPDHGPIELDVHLAGPADGVPVLLLHGFPQSARSWDRVVERLAGHGLRLVAPDQRGYSPGARPAAVAAYAVPRLVADVLAVADALDTGPFHLVGHDWGASVAWALAARHPERLRTLTALSVPHLAAFGAALREDPEQQRRSAYIRVFREPGRGEASLLDDDARGLRALYGGAVAAPDVEAYVDLMRSGALTPALGWYRAMDGDLAATPPVTVPTTFLWGADDLATSPTAAHACGTHVRADYRFVALEGASHWTPDECPDQVATAVLDRVLDRVPAQAPQEDRDRGA